MKRRRWSEVLFGAFVAPTVAAQSPVSGDSPDHAAHLSATYTGEVWADTTGERAYLDNLDVTLDLRGARWTLFSYVLYNNGHGTERLLETVQGVSNIEATDDVRLYEIWGEWRFDAVPLSIRAGLYDLNSEFDAIERAGLFINPSHGIGPDFSQSGLAGPSIFPLTGLAIRLAYSFEDGSVRIAALDGAPSDHDRLHISAAEGALFVAEFDRILANEWRVGLGAWRYSAWFEDVAAADTTGEPRQRRDNAGLYAFAEGALWSDAARSSVLDGFIRWGEAEDRIHDIRRYIGAGLVLQGFVPQRVEDALGLAVAIAELGAVQRTTPISFGRESIAELTYRHVLTENLKIQADVQYVRHPGFDATAAVEWIFGLRFEVGAELLR